jgi:hypothetical protein
MTVVIPGASHIIQLTHPEAVIGAVPELEGRK